MAELLFNISLQKLKFDQVSASLKLRWAFRKTARLTKIKLRFHEILKSF